MNTWPAGLDIEWDIDLYGRLLEIGGGKERMAAYFSVSIHTGTFFGDHVTAAYIHVSTFSLPTTSLPCFTYAMSVDHVPLNVQEIEGQEPFSSIQVQLAL